MEQWESKLRLKRDYLHTCQTEFEHKKSINSVFCIIKQVLNDLVKWGRRWDKGNDSEINECSVWLSVILVVCRYLRLLQREKKYISVSLLAILLIWESWYSICSYKTHHESILTPGLPHTIFFLLCFIADSRIPKEFKRRNFSSSRYLLDCVQVFLNWSSL